jgi:WD40 repeat protein
VRVWDASTGRQIFFANNGAFSPDGRRIASCGAGSKVSVCDAATGQEILAFKGNAGVSYHIAFSPDGGRIAIAGYGRASSNTIPPALGVWDASTGQEIFTLKGHTEHIEWIAFSPDGRRLASAGRDSTLRLWDASTGRETLVIKGHEFGFSSGAFSPDGRRLAICDSDRLRLWDVATWQEIPVPDGRAARVQFTPDGRWVVTDEGALRLRVWDAATGRGGFTFDLHSTSFRDVIHCMAFSPDGRRLAAAREGTVKLWDTITEQETLNLKGHPGLVTSVAFSPDGTRLASGCSDGTVKIWDARPMDDGPARTGTTPR